MANNTEPFEIIGVPFTVYVAAVGATFPDIDENPDPSDWTLIGSSGADNYDQEGVKVAHPQSLNTWRALGSPGPRKVFRTEEDCKISLMLADLTLEQYRYALNSNTVTHTPQTTGVSGYKKIGLSRGLSIATMAVLVRGVGGSGYGDYNAQYEIPLAQQTGSPEVVFRRDQPAMLALEWTALVDPNAATDDEKFGRLLMQESDVNS